MNDLGIVVVRGHQSPGSPRSGRPHPADERGRRPVSVPADATVRADRPPAVTARHGLGRVQRRQHGDDPCRSAACRRSSLAGAPNPARRTSRLGESGAGSLLSRRARPTTSRSWIAVAD